MDVHQKLVEHWREQWRWDQAAFNEMLERIAMVRLKTRIKSVATGWSTLGSHWPMDRLGVDGDEEDEA